MCAKSGITQLPFSQLGVEPQNFSGSEVSQLLTNIYQIMSFTLISPQRRNGELPPHYKIFCLSGVCAVMSHIKNLPKSVF